MKFRHPICNVFFAITTCAVGLGLLAATGYAQNRNQRFKRRLVPDHSRTIQECSDRRER